LFSVSFTSDEQEVAEISLVRPDGITVMRTTGHIRAGENTLEINASDIAGGLYLLTVRTGGENIVRRVVIR
jgi:hypothetical protein